MIIHHDKIEKYESAEGVMLQVLGFGERMNVLHWNMADGSIVPTHEHSEEQFGYCIRGGFRITIGEETHTMGAGDAYFIPPNAKHTFTAVGETEAIDVFNPIRHDYPKPMQK